MDVVTAGVCVALALVSGAVLLLISMLGMREKTYEEAVAEQRQQHRSNNPTNHTKSKPKPKPQPPQPKHKKHQHNKPKPADPDPPTQPPELHVTIAEVVEMRVTGSTMPPTDVGAIAPPNIDNKKKKNNKVKSILVKKEVAAAAAAAAAAPPPAVNHFVDTKPKDDLTLKKTSKGSAITEVAVEAVAETPPPPPEPPAPLQPTAAPPQQPVLAATAHAPSSASGSGSGTPADSSCSSPVPHKPSKEKKKKKSIVLTPNTSMTVGELSSLIVSASLSPYERQLLTDLLLRDDSAETGLTEWSEHALMHKLKKQLAEKELQLENELASSHGVQMKLKELRGELNEERVKLRQYEETMMGKMGEMQNIQRSFHQAQRDKQALMHELQQAQAKIKEDTLLIRSLQESGQQKVALQQDNLTLRQQIQQLELHLQHTAEAEVSLKRELHAASASYSAEMQSNRRLETELRAAREQLEAATAGHVSSQDLQHKLNESVAVTRQMEAEKQRVGCELADMTHQLTDARAQITQHIHDAAATNKQLTHLRAQNEQLSQKHQDNETDLSSKLISHEAEQRKKDVALQHAEVHLAETQTELVSARQQLAETQSELATARQQLADSQNTQGELASAREQLADSQSALAELASAREQLAQTQTELTTARQQLADSQSAQGELASAREELASTRLQLASVQTSSGQLTGLQAALTEAQNQLQAQTTKNNELRQKNWKAVDALSSAEKALDHATTRSHKLADMLTSLMPGLTLPEGGAGDVAAWKQPIQAALSRLTADATAGATAGADASSDNSDKVVELSGVVAHYKTIIDDTEAILKKLQNHIEAEEQRWRALLDHRQADIDALQHKVDEQGCVLSELKEQVSNSQQRILEKDDQLNLLCNDKSSLQKQLTSEQERIKDINKEIVKLKSNLKIGQDSYEAEHKIRLELEEKIKALGSSPGAAAAPIQNGTSN